MFKSTKAMIILIQNFVKDLATGLDQSTGYPVKARYTDLLVMEGAADEPHRPEPRVAVGGDDGDDGDVAVAAGNGEFGINAMDLGVIVDSILAELPEPARDHIFPDLEGYDGCGRPAL